LPTEISLPLFLPAPAAERDISNAPNRYDAFLRAVFPFTDSNILIGQSDSPSKIMSERIDDRSQLLEKFSSSVRAAAKNVGLQNRVSSWAIVQEISKLHPEYAKGMAEKLRHGKGPAQAITKPVSNWLEEILLLQGDSRANVEKVINGRQAILRLSESDPPLQEHLGSDLLELLRNEAGETPKPDAHAGSTLPPDPTPLHVDSPASDNELGRQAFARTLAIRLGRISNENLSANIDASFILHLHGAWGSGKSSVLNLLRSELQTPIGKNSAGSASDLRNGETSSRWVVVDFNAWQNQRLNPPWWPLLDTVYREARKQLSHTYKERHKAGILWAQEFWWRFVTSNHEPLLIIFGVFALSIVLCWLTILDWSGLEKLLHNASSNTIEMLGKAVSALLAVAGAVFAISSFLTRTFSSGSARAAQNFMQTTADPMGRVTTHFQHLVSCIDHPIIIFIDDLDRCQSEYVISLLEGIQTLFKDPRVIYVIAGDRRWLYACYEKVYEHFSTTVNEPGRRLGSLFLEKAVQLSVSLPKLSPDVQTTYWDYLIRGGSKSLRDSRDQAELEAANEFKGAGTPDQVAAKLKPELDPIRAQAFREQAVLRLATERAEQSTAYFLRNFASLLEPNPRAMKRLLNAYALHRDLAILAGKDVLRDLTRRSQLVLWTIVCLRWPQLEEILIGTPSYADSILNSTAFDSLPENLKPLFANASVRRVFSGDGVGVSLNPTIIEELTDLRAPGPSKHDDAG
jgi:hypothetical protein